MLELKSDKLLIWEKLATMNRRRSHIDKVLAHYKSEEFRGLIERWVGTLEYKRVLKTDLREEAYEEDGILFSLPSNNSQFFGVDIAEKITNDAYFRQKKKNLFHYYMAADVRNLPFKDDIFNVILSTSTLDHFTAQDDFTNSLLELKRVMKSKGTMIIAINNKCNMIFFLFLKLEQILRLVPYPVQLYSPWGLKKIIRDIGLYVQDEDFNVHIISPINSILIFLRRFMTKYIVDKIAEKYVSFARWLGRRKNTKIFTGWFVTLKCIKK